MAVAQAESGNISAHFTVSLTTSNPRISLSSLPSDAVPSIIVHAQRTDSGLITLYIAGSVFDNGLYARHDGIFRGGFLPLTSTSDPRGKNPATLLWLSKLWILAKCLCQLAEARVLALQDCPEPGRRRANSEARDFTRKIV